MYIHLGEETVVKEEEIIGIFDLESTTVSKHTRNFLTVCEKNNSVVNVSYKLPRSFILCSKGRSKKRVYISQLSSQTLYKRSGII